MAATRNKAVELFWKLHPTLYRWTGGRVGGRLMNLPVLVLRTVGRKTGRRRENALMYLPQGKDAWVVIASVLGEPRHPAWYLNLRAQPDTEIQLGSQRIPVRARDAQGAERDRLWHEVVAQQPDYAEYAKRTEREIPVVVLERR